MHVSPWLHEKSHRNLWDKKNVVAAQWNVQKTAARIRFHHLRELLIFFFPTRVAHWVVGGGQK